MTSENHVHTEVNSEVGTGNVPSTTKPKKTRNRNRNKKKNDSVNIDGNAPNDIKLDEDAASKTENPTKGSKISNEKKKKNQKSKNDNTTIESIVELNKETQNTTEDDEIRRRKEKNSKRTERRRRAEKTKTDEEVNKAEESNNGTMREKTALKKKKKLGRREREMKAKETKVGGELNNSNDKVNNETTEIPKQAGLDPNVEKSEATSGSSDVPLSLGQPLDLDIDLYSTLEFYCDCCPAEFNSYPAASNHTIDFSHNNMSVVYNSLSDVIKCQCCGEIDISQLCVILVNSEKLSTCCKPCLERAGFDPATYSFSTKETFLKYVDNMYRLNSLKCFSCESKENLQIDEDLTCYCSNCIAKDDDLKNSKFISRSDGKFLATFFEDAQYTEFSNSVHLSSPSSSPSSSPTLSSPQKATDSGSSSAVNELNGEKHNGHDKNEAKKKSSKKKQNAKNKENKQESSVKTTMKNSTEAKNGPEKSKRFTSSKNSKMLDDSTSNTSKTSKNLRANDSKTNNINKKSKIESSIQKLVQASHLPMSAEEKVENKFSNLKDIVRATLPKDIKLTFNTIDEYYNYLSYSLFLEELYTQDICTDVNLEWEDEETCTMTGSTKKWFDMYVSDEVHHLKKHPFTRDQPIFIIRKSDANLDWSSIPEFWIAHVSSSSLGKLTRKNKKITKVFKNAVQKKTNQVSSFCLKLYFWNASKFPVNENGNNFAFVPGGNVVGRILNSMKKIENKDFINLILGKEKVRKIKFSNKLDDRSKSLNNSQKEALQSALNNNITLLQGPPGSGKTSTIYEIILQLLTELHYYPILVVAASNLAVDNIAEKLLPKYEDIILRITSISKEKEYNEDHPLGSVCLHNKISKILPPNLKDIERRLKRNPSSISSAEFGKYMDACSLYGSKLVSQANIIFATTTGIAGPYLKKVKKMPVIIMDEATQSSEPSTLIPLGAQGCTKVILVGDTAQLSVFTRVKSLEMSLFQRVIENGSYPDAFMLDTQYRMHPDISSFPRRKFYDNKLQDGITAEDRIIKGIKYPVYFFDHKGVGAAESKLFSASGEEFGYSWVNKKEVTYIERMIVKLITEHNVPLSTIGVMTGYAAQRDLIVKALENNKIINPYSTQTNSYVDKEDLSEKKNVTVCNVNGIIVASIDAFQGREMNFVLMSCVRSNDSGSIGFMSDKRRMNVALTRAKYSFILCGDAKCLSSSKLWNEYILELRSKGYVKNTLNDY